jgi:hypothetical protein
MSDLGQESLALSLERQTTNYLRLGFHAHLGEAPHRFVNRFETLRTAVSDLVIAPADLLIMPVVPEALISLEDQLALSGNRAFLKSSDMQQVQTWQAEPEEPYALLGVSYGESLRHLSADDARAELATLGRTGLRLIELVSMGIHSSEEFTVEDIRGRYAVETLHVADEATTIVDFYRYGDSLKVKRDPGNINDPQWTTPSYDQAIILG